MDSKRSDSNAGFSVPSPYPVAAWVRPGRIGLADPLFAAGAGLTGLDRVMREAPVWSGVWVQRLRLQAAAVACRHLGRPESEQTLRDLWQLRTAGGAVGPAGAVLNAYQELGRADALHGDGLARAPSAFGVPEGRDGLARRLAEATRDKPPLQAAASAAGLVMQESGDSNAAELLALWAADAMLAQKLGWDRALPLLSGELPKPGGARRRPRPGEPDWLAGAALGAAIAAVRAIDLANEVARRAAKLQAVAREVRTRQAGVGIAMLLTQEAITPAQLRGKMSDRAARRLFDRLVALGGVRELSGRSMFRIYGL